MFPREHGKYTILTKYFMPWFSPNTPSQTVTKAKHGFQVELDLSEYLQAWIYTFGSYELPTVKFIRSTLKPGAACIDVGAQIGYITLVMASSQDRNVSVLSFEPEDANYAHLQRNLELNDLKNVTTVQKAVSSEPGSIKLYLSADENAGTHSTVFVEGNVSEKFIEIPCTTLDDEISSRGMQRLDLIKIDVEGAEIDVIRGATNTLKSLKPTIIAELSDALQEAAGFTCAQFKQYMIDLGYSPFTINEDGTLKTSGVNDSHLNDNVVFVHETRIDTVTIAS